MPINETNTWNSGTATLKRGQARQSQIKANAHMAYRCHILIQQGADLERDPSEVENR